MADLLSAPQRSLNINTIERFEMENVGIRDDHYVMSVDPDGEYVKYEDVARLVSSHAELLAIHEAVMNPMDVQILTSDTFTLQRVKEFIVRATRTVYSLAPAATVSAPVSETEAIPEGCTPADARVLREGNAILAEENHNLRRCLRFYANGDHYTGFDHWEGPSGDDNWLCPPMEESVNYRQQFIDQLDECLLEDGSIARATLISGKFDVEDPADEPKVIKGEPEWLIEQEAKKHG